MGLKPVSVSQLNSYIKRILQSDPILGNVTVIGEISNLKFHRSGHVYFSLKDENSSIRAFLPVDAFDDVDFKLEEGKEVIASGYLYLYERGGSYSLNIRSLEAEGEGQLMKEFRKLKKKLEAEGLFDAAHKKPIPAFPKRIAVVTSDSGAAVRDIVKIITSKNNVVDILIYPVLVNGAKAAPEIANAISDINERYKDVDTIIAGRGGGSMEDLWAFNEEIVARSIFASSIPVISAVGHEIDFTIADFVADKRAETPTAAADMAVPDISAIKETLENTVSDLDKNMHQILEINKSKLEAMNPKSVIRELKTRVAMDQIRCENIFRQLTDGIANRIKMFENKVEIAAEIVKSSNPEAILSRGYSIVRNDNNDIIKDSSTLCEGEKILITFAEGDAKATVGECRRHIDG